MLYSVFILVAVSLLFNWLYKKDGKVKQIVKPLIQFALFVLSIIALALGTTKVIFTIFYCFIILSSLIKLISNKHVLGKAFKFNDIEKEKKVFSKIELLSFYASPIVSISCVVTY